MSAVAVAGSYVHGEDCAWSNEDEWGEEERVAKLAEDDCTCMLHQLQDLVEADAARIAELEQALAGHDCGQQSAECPDKPFKCSVCRNAELEAENAKLVAYVELMDEKFKAREADTDER